MKIIPFKPKKYFILSFLLLFFFGGKPKEFGREYDFFHGFPISKPIIRIALGINLENIQVRSSSGMKVYQVDGSYNLLADDISEVRIKGRKEKLTEKFSVQITKSRSREEGEKAARELREKIENRVYIVEDRETGLGGMFQVRVGDFFTREEALRFIKKLNSIGIRDAWIVKEEISEDGTKPLWLLLNDELINLKEDSVLYFIPSSPHSYISYDRKSYRGIFLLRASRKGILLINILNLEDYLKGVVPGELSPYNYGEIEALKAQAVASRTYALKNRGLNEDLGYDLDDTPSSQVYRGIDVEHPLSTQAVDETKGEVAVYRGELINALYTSTCGGMTENVENVFEGRPLPYLRSTECVYERENEWTLKAKHVLPFIPAHGRNFSHRMAYLISLQVLPPETSFSFWKQPASFEETVGWIRSALALLRKRNENFISQKSTLNLVTFARLIVDAFQWQERVRNLVGKSEADYFFKEFPRLTEEEKNYLAYFVVAGIYPNSPLELIDREKSLTRVEVALFLDKIISTYRYFFHNGVVRGFNNDQIELMEGMKKKQLAVSPGIFLLRDVEDQFVFTSALELVGGENVKWVEINGEVRLLEVVSSPNSNILDKPSLYHRWQQRISREDLEVRLNQYYPVGSLVDVMAQKRGDSRRVIELKIIGTEGQVVVTGLKIRWVLGLRETLFVIDREYDSDGRVTHFVFSGKGWGHGVGLCQVGSFQMARKGADYREILKKYYRGITIDKMY
ncbi:MAG: SpoIID/LytB domain-containing protein [Candidatus Aminicenantales bacterium]